MFIEVSWFFRFGIFVRLLIFFPALPPPSWKRCRSSRRRSGRRGRISHLFLPLTVPHGLWSFFLAVVLIGTLYPVFLDTLIGEKISVGPPYYNFVLAPFLIPLLFLMTSGPKYKWVSSETKKFFDIIFRSTNNFIYYFQVQKTYFQVKKIVLSYNKLD